MLEQSQYAIPLLFIVALFPNPANYNMEIRKNQSDSWKDIFNGLDERAGRLTFEGRKERIDLQYLKQGFYFVVIEGKQGLHKASFMKY